MGTDAHARFDANAADVNRLLEIHGLVGGTDPGRRGPALQVLNRSGVVLVCAIWEAYVEDLAAEALQHLVDHVSAPSHLPKGLRKMVAAELRASKNDLGPWELADDGWKRYLAARLTRFQQARNRGLNTPKASNIESLFSDAIGLERVSADWYWAGMSRDRARQKLNEFVSLRGDIAHRGAVPGVQRGRVESFLNHVERLVGKTDGTVNAFVLRECGSALHS